MIIPNDIDFLAYLGQQESQELHFGVHWKDAMVEKARGTAQAMGDKLPWAKTHNNVRLRPGELSIWAGVNGHRKSMVVGQVMLWIANTKRVCIASLEMRPEETLYRMAKQAAGCHPSPEFVGRFADWTDQKICIYDQLDTVQADKILGMIHYAAKELGCAHIVIDSLTKVGLKTDDYTLQTAFVDRLQWAAKTYGCHVHLVCHMRKGSSEHDRPGKFDVRGASQITDLADNVFVCWKNKAREDVTRLVAQGMTLTDKESRLLDQCDQELIVEKQRHGEFEGPIRFWFHEQSLQMTPDDKCHPIPFEALPNVQTNSIAQRTGLDWDYDDRF